MHHGRLIDFTQLLCVTDRSLVLAHNTRLLRADCDGMIKFSTPGVEGTLSLSLCEIEYLRDDSTTPAPKPGGTPARGRSAAV